jgi:hypothetical protein
VRTGEIESQSGQDDLRADSELREHSTPGPAVKP